MGMVARRWPSKAACPEARMMKDRDPDLWVNQPAQLMAWQDRFLQSYLETLADAAEEGEVQDIALLLKHWKTATNVIGAVRSDIETIETEDTDPPPSR